MLILVKLWVTKPSASSIDRYRYSLVAHLSQSKEMDDDSNMAAMLRDAFANFKMTDFRTEFVSIMWDLTLRKLIWIYL